MKRRAGIACADPNSLRTRVLSSQRFLPVVRAILFTGSIAVLSACGGSTGGGSSNGGGASATPVLAGNPAQTASTILQDIDAGPVVKSDIVQGHLLTRLFVALKTDATVGQVNAAAATVGATAIAFSASDSLLLTLQIPRQAGIGDLHRLADLLRTQPGILSAYPAREFKASVLPELTPGQPVSPLDLSHLRPTRFPQAWNARGAAGSDCLPRSVPVYIWDKFGDSGSRPTFFNQIDFSGFVFDDVGSNAEESGHGFDVASTLGAKFDGQKPTGANPFKDCLIIKEIEAFGRDFQSAMFRALSAVRRETDSRFILNISMNFPDPLCGVNSDRDCDDTQIRLTPLDRLQDEVFQRVLLADSWATILSRTNLGQRMLITLSAGNIDPEPNGFLARNYLGFRHASFSSPVSLATQLGQVKNLLTNFASLWRSNTNSLLPDITFSQQKADSVVNHLNLLHAISGLPIGISAENLLVVLSVTEGETFADVTGSDFNFNAFPSVVTAVGENVRLFDMPSATGTSFAAPQVAGLASYLWVLSDDLRNQPVSATANVIKRTSRGFFVIDAYLSTLSLDQANGPQRIRKALLDVNNDGVFDFLDLLKFQQAYQLAPAIPSARDYSRFDLNGDGFTGGIIVAPFDLDVNGLDANGLPIINAVDRQIEGYEVTFNEAALSDIQILCFYAYSDLYQVGQQNDPRSTILGPERCVGVQMSAVFPAQISTPTNLDVTVKVPAGNGQFAPAPNLLVELTSTCAAVNPPSGRTNANGAISTTVTPNTGCSSVSVNAIASADVGAPLLAQTTVNATVTGSTGAGLAGQLTARHTEISDGLNFDESISVFVTVTLQPGSTDFTVSGITGTWNLLNKTTTNGCSFEQSFSGNAIRGEIVNGFTRFFIRSIPETTAGDPATPTPPFLGIVFLGTVTNTGTLFGGFSSCSAGPNTCTVFDADPICTDVSRPPEQKEIGAPLLPHKVVRSQDGSIIALDFNLPVTTQGGGAVTSTITGRLE